MELQKIAFRTVRILASLDYRKIKNSCRSYSLFALCPTFTCLLSILLMVNNVIIKHGHIGENSCLSQQLGQYIHVSESDALIKILNHYNNY